jgi:hypothetical protein|tara:strand:+ start:85 stop:312 length:228 start_codon:yes stop_codon:yes gene_type:complete
LHDAIELEQRGIPAAVIITDAFQHEADVQCEAFGASWLTPVVIEHPLSTLTDEQIDSRASQATDTLAITLTTDAV